MDLIALAVPFFLLALLLELAIDRVRGSGLYRANDAINSLSAGILSTTFGYVTKLLPLIAWGFVLKNFALIDMPLEWFDASARGSLSHAPKFHTISTLPLSFGSARLRKL